MTSAARGFLYCFPKLRRVCDPPCFGGQGVSTSFLCGTNSVGHDQDGESAAPEELPGAKGAGGPGALPEGAGSVLQLHVPGGLR